MRHYIGLIKRQWASANKNLKFLFVALYGSIASYLFIINWILSVVVVDGPSMEPTYHGGDVLLVNRLAMFLREPKKNDVVVMSIDRFESYNVKRVMGVPGETLISTDGTNKMTIGPNCYFVVGDNANESWDSRYYGPID